MFEKERFIEDCRAALAERTPQDAIRELVERAVREPAGIVRALGAPTRSGVEKVYHAPDLTILNLSWGPLMNVRPHDHRMWAIIGIYGGCEQNTFFRRNGQGLDRHGTRELSSGDAVRLGPDAIHAVKNPLDSITSAPWSPSSIAATGPARYCPKSMTRIPSRTPGMFRPPLLGSVSI